MSEQTRIDTQDPDRNYFTLVPRIVQERCTDVYRLALWLTIKGITGEKGECYLATPDLATLAMMSPGKVSQSRQALLDSGLLVGELRKDPNFPHAVWHVKIPDLWPINVQRANEMPRLKDRVDYKRHQRESLHRVKPSPGENIPSPGENILSPDADKEEPKEEPKEERLPPAAGSPSTPGPMALDRGQDPTWSKHVPVKGDVIMGIVRDLRDELELKPVSQRAPSGESTFKGSFFTVKPPEASDVEVHELRTDATDTSLTCVCDEIIEWPSGHQRRQKAPALVCPGCQGLLIVHGYKNGNEAQPYTYKHPNLPTPVWTVSFDGFGPGLLNIPCELDDARRLWKCDKADGEKLRDKVQWVHERNYWKSWPKEAIIKRIIKAWHTSTENDAQKAVAEQTIIEDNSDFEKIFADELA